MLIGNLNQAFTTINAMNRNELNELMNALEKWFGERCYDRRRKRDYCKNITCMFWNEARWDIVRMIYNAQES